MRVKDYLNKIIGFEVDDKFERFGLNLQVNVLDQLNETLTLFPSNPLSFIGRLILNTSYDYSVEKLKEKNCSFIKKYFVGEFDSFQKIVIPLLRESNEKSGYELIYKTQYDCYNGPLWLSYNNLSWMVVNVFFSIIRTIFSPELFNFELSSKDRFVLIIYIWLVCFVWEGFMDKEILSCDDYENCKCKITKEISEILHNYNIIYEYDSFDIHTELITDLINKATDEVYNNEIGLNWSFTKEYNKHVTITRWLTFFLFLFIKYDSRLALQINSEVPHSIQQFFRYINILQNNLVKQSIYEEILKKKIVEKQFDTYFNKSATTLFEVSNFSQSFENNLIFDNVNIKIPSNKFIIFYGNSGTGKTVFYNILVKLIPSTSGQFTFMEDYPHYVYENIRKNVSIVKSNTDLFHKSAFYNITYGVSEVTEDIKKQINYYLHLFKMEKFIDNLETVETMSMSLGQQQRVKIIRLIIADKPIWILDEITSNLDEDLELLVTKELLRIQKEKKKSVIFITHKKDLNCLGDLKMYVKDKQLFFE